ncbi:MAG: relaxase domain-containing protein [Verrucomicrobia bacterium]|nr:relaxase domain-containing protein [Verrucomicrobiota bacterium]
MMTARSQKNLATARTYFKAHLQGQPEEFGVSPGQWFGLGAHRLGLHGLVEAQSFERLCENLHPITGQQLTPLTLPDRRIYYDFPLSAPKGVSLLALTFGDHRLLTLHDHAVGRAVARLEEFAQTRVRTDGRNYDRPTGEVVAALLREALSRANDPQVHTHVLVFNATWDAGEQRWKALQAGAIYDAIRYLTEVYRSELAAGLKDLGYRLRPNRHGFEIDGIAPELLRRFSQRTQQIDAEQARREAGLGRPLSRRGRATIAAATRPGKSSSSPLTETIAAQRARLTAAEQAGLEGLVRRARGVRVESVAITPGQALDHARDHLFERASVVPRHELLREALIHGRGDVRDQDLARSLQQRPEFIHRDGQVTTCEILRLERELIAWVNAQNGRHRAFAPVARGECSLNDAQRRALNHLLASSDGVTHLGGGAGTGKTHVLRSFVHTLAERGHEVMPCAPTTGAVDVLRQGGFGTATTVQALLTSESLQRAAAGRVLLVDEANLLSVRQFQALFQIARLRGCRIVLSGDTRQHHSVEAGDALRVLVSHSQLQSVTLEEIIRQKPAAYRAAVTEVAAGRIAAGYRQLQQIGAIVQTTGNQHEQLAQEYADSLRDRKSALIVAPTWREISGVTRVVSKPAQARPAAGDRGHDGAHPRIARLDRGPTTGCPQLPARADPHLSSPDQTVRPGRLGPGGGGGGGPDSGGSKRWAPGGHHPQTSQVLRCRTGGCPARRPRGAAAHPGQFPATKTHQRPDCHRQPHRSPRPHPPGRRTAD